MLEILYDPFQMLHITNATHNYSGETNKNNLIKVKSRTHSLIFIFKLLYLYNDDHLN